MSGDTTTLERAFQIARSGRCSNIADLTKALKAERFDAVDAQLMPPSLRLQLRTIMTQTRPKKASPAE